MTALGQALVISYHGVGAGPPPLFVGRSVLRAQLDALVDYGARTLTVSELSEALHDGSLPPRAVALAFHDGLRSVFDEAAPLLVERGFTATVFCVAGRLGGHNDWASPYRRPRSRLMGPDELTELAACGFEIGSHGMDHVVLPPVPSHALRREVTDSRAVLEEVTGTPAASFAFPYGVVPGSKARGLVEETYSGACCGRLGAVTAGTDPFALPRVEAHYLRRPGVLRRALVGSFPPYLRARRARARARRLLLPADDPIPSL